MPTITAVLYLFRKIMKISTAFQKCGLCLKFQDLWFVRERKTTYRQTNHTDRQTENTESIHNKKHANLILSQHLFWPTVLTIFSHISHLSSTILCAPAFCHLLSNQQSSNLFWRKQPQDLEKLQISVKPLFLVQNPWEKCSPPALRPSAGQQSILFSSVSFRSVDSLFIAQASWACNSVNWTSLTYFQQAQSWNQNRRS